jgi:hypothetical protein
MPHTWNNILVVTVDELVPRCYSTINTLKSNLQRYANKSYGIKKVCIGGNGRQMLIDFDSLSSEIRDAIGDPRKCDHILEKFYRIDGEAVIFFRDFRFEDGSALKQETQDRYLINASMIKALFALKFARETERISKGSSTRGIMATLCADSISFQATLKAKHNEQHTLPNNERKFKEALNAFEKEGYSSIISGKHKNKNALKVTDQTLTLLNSIFARSPLSKPTPTEVHHQYQAFINGHVQIISNETGELFNPADFKALSDRTVTKWLTEWASRIGTYAVRSGDRQKHLNQFKPYHSMKLPDYAGAILSIDDRQPPFKCLELKGGRIWFYNGLDVASDAFICAVHGDTKEGLILEFYRQLVRNYAEWGFNLPNELEAEASLNSSFTNTFLRPGAMFQKVHIEANNARAKIIERRFGDLRYRIEKKLEGWQARPHARRESNQAGPEKAKLLPYETIANGSIQAMVQYNNEPHPKHPQLSRWEYFCQNQHPNLQPTNYLSILPYIGHKTPSSCNLGFLRFRRTRDWVLGDNGKIATGDKLINLMRRVEGEKVDIYWLDGNDGLVIKALVFIGDEYICEAMPKPAYNRATIEQTTDDLINKELMNSYEATISAFGRRQKAGLERLTLIDNTPLPPQKFVMPGTKRLEQPEPTGGLLPEPKQEETVPTYTNSDDIEDW